MGHNMKWDTMCCGGHHLYGYFKYSAHALQGQCEEKDRDAEHAVCNMAGGTLVHKDVNSTGKQKDI